MRLFIMTKEIREYREIENDLYNKIVEQATPEVERVNESKEKPDYKYTITVEDWLNLIIESGLIRYNPTNRQLYLMTDRNQFVALTDDRYRYVYRLINYIEHRLIQNLFNKRGGLKLAEIGIRRLRELSQLIKNIDVNRIDTIDDDQFHDEYIVYSNGAFKKDDLRQFKFEPIDISTIDLQTSDGFLESISHSFDLITLDEIEQTPFTSRRLIRYLHQWFPTDEMLKNGLKSFKALIEHPQEYPFVVFNVQDPEKDFEVDYFTKFFQLVVDYDQLSTLIVDSLDVEDKNFKFVEKRLNSPTDRITTLVYEIGENVELGDVDKLIEFNRLRNLTTVVISNTNVSLPDQLLNRAFVTNVNGQTFKDVSGFYRVDPRIAHSHVVFTQS